MKKKAKRKSLTEIAMETKGKASRGGQRSWFSLCTDELQGELLELRAQCQSYKLPVSTRDLWEQLRDHRTDSDRPRMPALQTFRVWLLEKGEGDG